MNESKSPKIEVSWYLPTQVILLVIHYGNIVEGLPNWVLWFPSLIFAGIIILSLLILGVVALFVWFKESIENKLAWYKWKKANTKGDE